MTTHKHVRKGRSLLASFAVIAALLPVVQLASSPVRAAGTSYVDPTSSYASGSIKLAVTSARTVGQNAVGGPHTFVQEGDPVTSYKWLINRDDTGNPGTAADPLFNACQPYLQDANGLPTTTPNPDPSWATKCPWPSIRQSKGWADIVAQGDETDLGTSKPLTNLRGGKYLLSITADGYKIDGAQATGGPGRRVERTSRARGRLREEPRQLLGSSRADPSGGAGSGGPG